jgi:hypothetical protein
MTTVTVTYGGGLNVDRDLTLRVLASRGGGIAGGSGQAMFPPYLRDLAFQFTNKKKAAGFATYVRRTFRWARVAT